MDSSDHNIIISDEEDQVGHESNVASTPTTQTSTGTTTKKKVNLIVSDKRLQ